MFGKVRESFKVLLQPLTETALIGSFRLTKFSGCGVVLERADLIV